MIRFLINNCPMEGQTLNGIEGVWLEDGQVVINWLPGDATVYTDIEVVKRFLERDGGVIEYLDDTNDNRPGEIDFDEIVEAQGWNDEPEFDLYRDFIKRQGLTAALLKH